MPEWIAVITITLFAVISPGADFAMVTRNALLRSRRAGMLTALGIGLGVLVHVGYTLLGVGLLMRESPRLLDVVRLLGAAYLVYLGVTLLRSRPCTGQAQQGAAVLSDMAALRMGFLTNVLNPKTTVFIVSLFLQVVQPATGLGTQLAYGGFVSLAHMAWFCLVARCFSAQRVRQRLLAVRHWIDRGFGAMLVGFGLLLASTQIRLAS